MFTEFHHEAAVTRQQELLDDLARQRLGRPDRMAGQAPAAGFRPLVIRALSRVGRPTPTGSSPA